MITMINSGDGNAIYVHQLKKRGQSIVVPLLKEWSELCGPSLKSKILVKFA